MGLVVCARQVGHGFRAGQVGLSVWDGHVNIAVCAGQVVLLSWLRDRFMLRLSVTSCSLRLTICTNCINLRYSEMTAR